MMTSKEKIKDILDWIQNSTDADWNCLQYLKQDLENLVIAAQTEGIQEARDILNKTLNKEK
jgi:hypothetical protein